MGEGPLFARLHQHLSALYQPEGCCPPETQNLSAGDDLKKLFRKCSDAFRKAVAVVANKGTFKAEDLRRPEMQALTDATYNALRHALNTTITESVPAALTASLQRSAHVFSGMKTYTALKETSALLTDAQGKPRPFEAFKADVLKLDKTYNQNYLEAEYQFATHSARMAAQWQQYAQDGDRYDLQYRTANDDRVRASHQVLHNVTLPPSDPFWSQYYPPNGWRCRCTVQQVRRGKYPASDPDAANKAGEEATTQIGKDGKNKGAIFRFNPGQDKTLFPKDHPYTYAGNCKTKLSSDSNDKCKALTVVQEDAATRFGKVAQRAEEHKKLRKDKNYKNVQFDPATGGLQATHVLHNFHHGTGKHEIEVANLLFKNGDKIILGKEKAAKGEKVKDGKKSPDGTYNDQLCDISSIFGSGKYTIKNALQHCQGKKAEVAIINFPDSSLYSEERILNGIAMFNGISSYRFKEIVIIHDGKVHKKSHL